MITSDRDIMSYAWSAGSVPMPSSEFLPLIERDEISLSGEYDLIEEDHDEAPRKKGNPQMLSRKEKSLLRVRRKL